MQRVRGFMASSLDGFIAGPNGEIDWLTRYEGVEDTFSPFFNEVGAMLMGRNTFDVVAGLGGQWPYGETPVLVASHRPLTTERASVRKVTGDIEALVSQAKDGAGERDVYIDGGKLIRSAMDRGLIDELILTVIPIVLGEGIPLFGGSMRRRDLELQGCREIGAGLVELRYSLASR